MSQDEGQCCRKLFLTLSSGVVMEGIAFVGFGVFLLYIGISSTTIAWVLMAQGALMVINGACGCALAKSSGVKVIYVLLAFLALADIILPMVVYFNCKESCPTILPDIYPDKELVIGLFLGTAVLLIITLVSGICLLRQRRRVNIEFSAHFKATS